MDTTAIITLMMQIVDALIKYGPTAIADIENIWANLKLAYESATSGTALTADQQAQYDTALSSAQSAIDNAIAAQQAQT